MIFGFLWLVLTVLSVWNIIFIYKTKDLQVLTVMCILSVLFGFLSFINFTGAMQ